MARARAVGRYLEALQKQRRQRGRPRSPERIRARLPEIERELTTARALARLRLIQEQKDLRRALDNMENAPDLSVLEVDFVAHAKELADREGIERTTWLAFGVPRAVLDRAGITESDPLTLGTGTPGA